MALRVPTGLQAARGVNAIIASVCRSTPATVDSGEHVKVLNCHLFATVCALAAASLPSLSLAQVSLSGGVEYFRWEEDTSPTVTETGPLLNFGFNYFTPKTLGWVLGYRGKVWLGSVDYEGSTLFPPNTPVQSTTEYTGFSNELQIRYRVPAQSNRVSDLVLGLGYDAWERELSTVQREDFDVFYARVGFENQSGRAKSWSFGGGLKYPFRIREDAHLDEVGFDANPELEPGAAVSFYAEIAYRVDPRWRLVGYYDGYRLTQSDPVQVNAISPPLGPVTLFQPESTMSVLGLKLEYLVP
jgi:hypothetical protein